MKSIEQIQAGSPGAKQPHLMQQAEPAAVPHGTDWSWWSAISLAPVFAWNWWIHVCRYFPNGAEGVLVRRGLQV
jgi:hypothetical protein